MNILCLGPLERSTESARRSGQRARSLLLRSALLLALAAALGLGAHGCAKKKKGPVAPLEPEYGTLEIGSFPAGAAIRVDGVDMDATTPDDFTLPAGSHRIRVSLGGHVFTPAETTLAVRAEDHVQFSFVEYAPVVTTNVTGHVFEPQGLSTTSAPWCFQVENSGNVVADSGAFTLTGADSADYAIVSGATYRDLAPGASVPVCVAFHPSHRGASSASVRVGRGAVTLQGSGYR